MVDSFYSVPHGNDESYVEAIRGIYRHTENIDAILPESTPELIPLAGFLDAVVSPAKALKRTVNKGCMLERFDKDLAPTYKVVRTFAEMQTAVHDLGYPKNKLVIKPCVADGSRGLRILTPNVDKVKSFLDKPGVVEDSWVGVRGIIHAASGRKELPEYLVMEYLPGIEYSVDCIPELNVAVVRERTVTRYGIAWTSRVVKMPSLSNTALQICDKLGLRYNINIQFKEDINKVPKIIEINPRVSGTIVACIKAGINLPHLAIKKFLGKSISDKELEYKTGTLYRYWGGLWHE